MDDTAGAASPVYPEREDTRLLQRFAAVRPGTLVLEVGCGSGAVARSAARAGGRVVATDLNPFALRATAGSARREHLPVALVRTDLAAGLGRFDRVLCNPPYLPTPPAARDPDRWLNLALDGGPDGLTVTRRLVAALPDHLRPGGTAFLLFSSRQPAAARERLVRDWREGGGAGQRAAGTSVGDETLEVWAFRAADA